MTPKIYTKTSQDRWEDELENLGITLAEDNGPLIEIEKFLTPVQKHEIREKYLELSLYLERVLYETIERETARPALYQRPDYKGFARFLD